MKDLNCPFCSSESSRLELYYDTEDGICCPNPLCEIGGQAMPTAAWNTRADTELVTALEKAYGMISTEKGYCPQCGDGTGAYYDNQGEICQCQWCYEAVAIKAALAKHRGE